MAGHVEHPDVLVVTADVSPLLSAGIGAAGGLAAGLVTALAGEQYKNRVARVGIARLLHEDFSRQQITLARAVYRGRWWHAFELFPAQITDEQYARLTAACGADEWDTIASARGWMTYLAARRADVCAASAGDELPPLGSDEHLVRQTYHKLALARGALLAAAARLGEPMEWRPNNHLAIRDTESGVSAEVNAPRGTLAASPQAEWLSPSPAAR